MFVVDIVTRERGGVPPSLDQGLKQMFKILKCLISPEGLLINMLMGLNIPWKCQVNILEICQVRSHRSLISPSGLVEIGAYACNNTNGNLSQTSEEWKSRTTLFGRSVKRVGRRRRGKKENAVTSAHYHLRHLWAAHKPRADQISVLNTQQQQCNKKKMMLRNRMEF